MRNIIVFVFALALCSASYGQDLIVTSSGDSLKCKIIDLGNDEIQFRFGADGNVISIKKSDVASYKYNFEAAPAALPASNRPAASKPPAEARTVAVKEKPKHLPFYVSAVAGYMKPVNLSFGDDDDDDDDDDGGGGAKKGRMIFGLDLGYYFNRNYGIGFKFNMAGCNITTGDDYETAKYRDTEIFWGPMFYGRWGDIVAFNLKAGAGGLTRRISDIVIGEFVKFDRTVSKTSFGGHLSIGFDVKIHQHLGLEFNAFTNVGSVKQTLPFGLGGMIPSKRDIFAVGFTAGVHFRF